MYISFYMNLNFKLAMIKGERSMIGRIGGWKEIGRTQRDMRDKIIYKPDQ